MTRFMCLLLLCLFCLFIFINPAWSAEKRLSDPQKKDKVATQGKQEKTDIKKKPVPRSVSPLFSYKPPLRGAPGKRIGGGTRGGSDEGPFIMVLSPDHTGLTIRECPVLCWYLSSPTKTNVLFTLNDEEMGETIIEEELNPASEKGIYCVDLSATGTPLTVGKEYTWFVIIEVDPDDPGKDKFSGGVVKRILPPDELKERLSSASAENFAAIFAESGIWYDALAVLSEAISKDPENSMLRLHRAALVEQVGLSEPANFDREWKKYTKSPID